MQRVVMDFMHYFDLCGKLASSPVPDEHQLQLCLQVRLALAAHVPYCRAVMACTKWLMLHGLLLGAGSASVITLHGHLSNMHAAWCQARLPVHPYRQCQGHLPVNSCLGTCWRGQSV